MQSTIAVAPLTRELIFIEHKIKSTPVKSAELFVRAFLL